MKYTNHREFYAKPDLLGDDFALLYEAIADAFRGMAADPGFDSRFSRLRSCGEDC